MTDWTKEARIEAQKREIERTKNYLNNLDEEAQCWRTKLYGLENRMNFEHRYLTYLEHELERMTGG